MHRLIVHARQDTAHALGNTVSILKELELMKGSLRMMWFATLFIGILIGMMAFGVFPRH